ncbi:MAG TPA: hypothetical protein ENK55_09075 [Actinobacteria bacterium]|nr:hypothetical protein [Actinomycetota bacterium]
MTEPPFHPGDPWHPDWTPPDEPEEDPFTVPERRPGEGRRGFLRRIFGNRGDDEPTAAERRYRELEPGDPEPEAPDAVASPSMGTFDDWLEEGERDDPTAPVDPDGPATHDVDSTPEVGDETTELEPVPDEVAVEDPGGAAQGAAGGVELEEITAELAPVSGDAAGVPGAAVDEVPAGGVEELSSSEVDVAPPEDAGQEDTAELVALIEAPGDEEPEELPWSVDGLSWEGEDEGDGAAAGPEAGLPEEERSRDDVEAEPPDLALADGEADAEADEEPVGTSDEDTGEVFLADTEGDEYDEVGPPPFDLDLSEEDYYLQQVTREHVELAAAIDAAGLEDPAPAPVAASIPGLDSGVVGFEDVVAAEGHEPVPAAADRGELWRRVGAALALAGLFVVSLLWRPVLVAFAVVVLVVTAGEFYRELMRERYRPVPLFGLIGVVGAALGAVRFGPVAIPVVLSLAAVGLLLFYAVVPGREEPLTSFSSTLLVLAWVGGLAGFAFPILQAPDYRALALGVVGLVVAMDVAQYVVGRSIGRRRLAPVLSPKKTVEGLVGGVVVTLALGALVGFVRPFDLGSGLLLGGVVAVFGPIGDLAVSSTKRAMGIKDMGSILPGHGGLLDRIDGLVFVLPAAWVAFSWVGLL